MAYLSLESIIQGIYGMQSAIPLVAWLLTYLVHSTLFLSVVWLVCRILGERRLAIQELLWKTALIAGMVTASVQPIVDWTPVGRSILIADSAGSTGSTGSRFGATATLPPVNGQTVRKPQSRIAVPTSVPPSPTLSTPVEEAANRADIGVVPLVSPRGSLSIVLLLLIWSGGALTLAFRLAMSYALLARRLKHRRSVEDGPLFKIFAKLRRAAASIKGLQLTRSPNIAVPLAYGVLKPEICVPSRVVTDMESEQQETVLAHEMAHALRRDPAWLMLSRVVESVLCLQPLNILGRRKLQQISEYRCDDWAVRRTGRPIALAKCLTSVAQWNLRVAGPHAVPSMAGTGRHFSDRIQRLLDRGYPRPDEARPKWLLVAVGAALLVTMITVPSFSGGSTAEEIQAAAVEGVVPEVREAPEAPASPAPLAPTMPTVPMAQRDFTPAPPVLAPVVPTVPPAPAAQVESVPALAPPNPTAQPTTSPRPAAAPSTAPEAPRLPRASDAPQAPEAPAVTSVAMEVELAELEIAIAAIEAALVGLDVEMDLAFDPEIEIDLENLEMKLEMAFEGFDEELERELEALKVEIENIERTIEVELGDALAFDMNAAFVIGKEQNVRMEALHQQLAAINGAAVRSNPISAVEIERIRSEIERAVKEAVPSAEEMQRIRQAALRAAEGARRSSKQAREIAEQGRRIGLEAARRARESLPSREQLDKIMASAQRAARPFPQQLREIREQARQARETNRVDREQARDELQKRRTELEKDRQEMQERRFQFEREQREEEDG